MYGIGGGYINDKDPKSGAFVIFFAFFDENIWRIEDFGLTLVVT